VTGRPRGLRGGRLLAPCRHVKLQPEVGAGHMCSLPLWVSAAERKQGVPGQPPKTERGSGPVHTLLSVTRCEEEGGHPVPVQSSVTEAL